MFASLLTAVHRSLIHVQTWGWLEQRNYTCRVLGGGL